jgi:hypothetical protein
MAVSLAAVFSGLQQPPPFAADHVCALDQCPKRGHGRAIFVAALQRAGEQRMSGFSRPKPFRTLYLRGPGDGGGPPGASWSVPWCASVHGRN